MSGKLKVNQGRAVLDAFEKRRQEHRAYGREAAKGHHALGDGKVLRKRRARLNDRRNAHASTLRSLPNSANPLAFRAPGSLR